MNNLHLKLFSSFIIVFGTSLMAFAYQTLVFDFPKGEPWIVAYHAKQGTETIVQYVPSGQSYESWNRALIVHSYNDVNTNATRLLRDLTGQLEKFNSYKPYVFVRANVEDAIATRCVISNSVMSAQCDIYRVLAAFEGFITIQYINKNEEDFKNNYLKWLDVVKKAKPYYSYYRTDRVMDKGLNFEL